MIKPQEKESLRKMKNNIYLRKDKAEEKHEGSIKYQQQNKNS